MRTCWIIRKNTTKPAFLLHTALVWVVFLEPNEIILGQESTGKILGTVLDQTGAVVQQALVTATSPTLPKGLQTTSDQKGNYLLAYVPVGNYTVTVSKTGFTTWKQIGIEVKLGSEITLNPRLIVGEMSQIVEVSELPGSIDVTSSRTAANITSSQVANLPKGRTFDSLLVMAPGVRVEPKAGNVGIGGIQVDGASGSENTFYIDGVEVSDLFSGALRAANAVPVEFVKEVQVKSGGFEAEYGGATGGVVNVATRGGANAFHGEVSFQFASDGLNAGDRGYWKFHPSNIRVADFFRPREDDYRLYYPGLALGGPLLKDRLYFFGGYFPELERTMRTIGYPSGPRVFTQERKRHYGLARLDFTPSSRVQVNTSWVWSPERKSGELWDRDPRIDPPDGDLSIRGHFRPSQTYSATLTFTASNRLLLGARYGYKYFNNKGDNYGIPNLPYIEYETASSQALGVPEQFAGPAGYRNVASTFLTLRDITTRHNVYLDGTYIAMLGGQQHILKTGYAVNRVANDVEDDYTNGWFRIYWGDAYNRGSITDARGIYGFYIWNDGVRHNSKVSGRNQGFYVQDTWRVHPHFTLNLGVRFENEFLPPYTKEVNGVKVANPISFGWGEKVAPRVGVAWDVLGRGKWKLSGSYGVFYDVMKYELARASFGGDYWFTHVYQLDNPNVFALSKANPGALGSNIISHDSRSSQVNSRGELEGIDPDIKPYASRELTVSLEHQLGTRWVGGIRYTNKHLIRAIEDIGVLDAQDNQVYLIGNPGLGQTRDTSSVYGQKTPNGQEFLFQKAKRRYDGLEFRLQGQADKFHILTSYTYSRLTGNFPGLASSDESGRSDPNISLAFDSPHYNFDSSGSQRPVEGRLGTDRPNAFKVFGAYELKSRAGATTVGVNQLAYSGTPDSTFLLYISRLTLPNGRGDLGRTSAYTQTDLLVSHTVKLRERLRLTLEADIRNLFNQATVLNRVTVINRTTAAITEARLPVDQFFKGYHLSDYVSPSDEGYNVLYGLPGGNLFVGGPGFSRDVQLSSAFWVGTPNYGAYQGFRSIRFGIRLIF